MTSAPAQEPATTLILVRHGETEDNYARIPRGQGHGSLTDLGWAQAHAIAERLGQRPFDHLYCSDLQRAIQTASALSSVSGHVARQEVLLRERHFGMFEGIPWDEIATRYPIELARHRSGDPDFAPSGGESLRQLQERSLQCLEDIASHHVGATTVVVTHGGVIHSILRGVLGIPLGTPSRFSTANGSLSVLHHRDAIWRLLTYGDVCHLSALGPG